MTFKHDHIHLRCQDLEASVKYYEEMFGGEVVVWPRLTPATVTANDEVAGANWRPSKSATKWSRSLSMRGRETSPQSQEEPEV